MIPPALNSSCRGIRYWRLGYIASHLFSVDLCFSKCQVRAQGLTNTIILTFHFPARLSRLQDSLLDGGGGTPQIQELERWTVLSNAQRGQNTETSTPKRTRESRLPAPGLGSELQAPPCQEMPGRRTRSLPLPQGQGGKKESLDCPHFWAVQAG